MLPTLFTHVMASEVETIPRSCFENEPRMQTRGISGSIARVNRGRHDEAHSHTCLLGTRELVGMCLHCVHFCL